jgi:hypothetical protein
VTASPKTPDPVLADPTTERLATLAELAAYEPPWDDPALYRDWSLTGEEET